MNIGEHGYLRLPWKVAIWMVHVCVQQTYPIVAGQVSKPYSGTSGSYAGSLTAAEDQENYEQSQQMEELSESSRERQRDRDYDGERDRDYSRRRRSDDR